MTVTYGFELDGFLRGDLLRRAWALVQRQFPYAATSIQTSGGAACFVHDVQLAPNVAWAPMAELPPFQEQLLRAANARRNLHQGAFAVDLISCGQRHILTGAMSHAGMDGTSGYAVMIALLRHLGALATGLDPLEAPPQPLGDVLSGLPASAPLPAPAIPERFMPQLAPLEGLPVGAPASTHALFAELSASDTAALHARCRAAGASLQGAVAAACMIATAAVQAALHPLPQTLLVQCPADVRQQVVPPVPRHAGGQGTGLLLWAQRLAPEDVLTAVAAEATESLRRERAAGAAVGFLCRLHAGATPDQAAALPPAPVPPFTVSSTCLGVTPVLAAYGALRVLQTHAMVSTPGVEPDQALQAAGSYCIAHVVQDRLLSTLTYSLPAIGHARGQALAYRLRITAISLPQQLGDVPLTCSSGDGEHMQWDVVALGNLCVDIVTELDVMPPPAEVKSEGLLRSLMQRPPAKHTWEVGGNCNFMIAAARLGLRVASVGNLGDDVYGRFLRDILQEEGVGHIEALTPGSFAEELRDTLLCFVLIGPASAHAFCSRYDFGPWPLLPGVTALPHAVLQVLRSTHSLLINGFLFDELAPAVIMAAVAEARAAGAAIFFDPGPRSWTLTQGARRAALDALLDATDVVLMTQEEAEAITGLADPEAACRALLQRRGAATQWCCVKLGSRGAVLCTRSPEATFRQHALLVDVQDTVGCGDSFAAAVVLGYTCGHPIPPVMALANAVGAATAMGQGAGRNVATTASAQPAGAVAWRSFSAQAPGEAPPVHPPQDDADTHDDFKPKFQPEPRSADIADTIRADISQHKVFVYMKGSPEAPQCGFSNQVCRILDAYGVDYGSRNVLADPDLRSGIKDFSSWPTVPQVYVGGEFIGGADILWKMHEDGQLAQALQPGTGAAKSTG
ncbi:hypothetical protein WJX81_003466 [Elliptochloris bilobata]|uniref:Uncharacterized protein n=1 Tax=Elliptochloris bilobata TaxID=381761 RepID=A0AAW1RBG1_9CHLO